MVPQTPEVLRDFFLHARQVADKGHKASLDAGSLWPKQGVIFTKKPFYTYEKAFLVIRKRLLRSTNKAFW